MTQGMGIPNRSGERRIRLWTPIFYMAKPSASMGSRADGSSEVDAAAYTFRSYTTRSYSHDRQT